jgi:hypothetical protein
MIKLKMVELALSNSHNSHIWLGGDFNLGGINWENGSIRSKASNTKQCKQPLDISHDHALEQMVIKLTYITESSQSTLDYFFINNRTLINKVEVIQGISDHEVVYVHSSL